MTSNNEILTTFWSARPGTAFYTTDAVGYAFRLLQHVSFEAKLFVSSFEVRLDHFIRVTGRSRPFCKAFTSKEPLKNM